MKQRVLSKAAPFHPLFKKKKKGKAQNGAILNGTMGLLLPLDARGRGRRRFHSPAFLSSLFLRKP
jgi:hypothetical protein